MIGKFGIEWNIGTRSIPGGQNHQNMFTAAVVKTGGLEQAAADGIKHGWQQVWRGQIGCNGCVHQRANQHQEAEQAYQAGAQRDNGAIKPALSVLFIGRPAFAAAAQERNGIHNSILSEAKICNAGKKRIAKLSQRG